MESQAYYSNEEEISDGYRPAKGKGESRHTQYSDEELPSDKEYSAKERKNHVVRNTLMRVMGATTRTEEDLSRALVHRKDTRT